MTRTKTLLLTAGMIGALAAGGATMAAQFGGAAAGGATPGWSQDGGSRQGWGGAERGGFRHHNGGFELRELGRVGLTDAQKSQILDLIKANRTKLQALRQEERDARKSLAQTKPDDANYSAALDAAADKVGDAAKQRFELRGQLRTSIENVLTADQKTKLAALRTQAEYRRVFGDDGQGRGNWNRGGNAAPAGQAAQ